jgi:glycerol dehydrogenase-like iron-containing ADH family enzyme
MMLSAKGADLIIGVGGGRAVDTLDSTNISSSTDLHVLNVFVGLKS